jgi:hypothetical protein
MQPLVAEAAMNAAADHRHTGQLARKVLRQYLAKKKRTR